VRGALRRRPGAGAPRPAAAPSLDVTGVDRRSGDEYSLRRILLHLIQECARHDGHADVIREGIDGATGV
jgi:hypothetical protein